MTTSTTPKSVEDTYKKLTQKQHVLLRPDTYIGSVQPVGGSSVRAAQQQQQQFVLSTNGSAIVAAQSEDAQHTVPGLFKIFDEILVNAADNKQRDKRGTTRLEVTLNVDEGWVRVWNNGESLPIVVHKEHGMYVPQLTFGELLTGSNFDDKEARTTGGRNGYGAKLANLFSTQFVVDCVGKGARGELLHYHQCFRANMDIADPPVVRPVVPGLWSGLGAADLPPGFRAADGSVLPPCTMTCITFSPDARLFQFAPGAGPGGLRHHWALFARRAVDIAGTTTLVLKGKSVPPLEVSVCVLGDAPPNPLSSGTAADGHEDDEATTTTPAGRGCGGLPPPTSYRFGSFREYLALYASSLPPPVFLERIDPHWEVGVGVNPCGSEFRHLSFVNGIHTSNGGTHVQCVQRQVVEYLQEKVIPKLKIGGGGVGTAMSTAQLKGYLVVYVNALIVNPAFGTQTKETLVTREAQFGSTCALPAPLLARLGAHEGLQSALRARAQANEQQALNKSLSASAGSRRQLFVDKLTDAHKAGTRESVQCTLLLTEGDSAKTLVLSGLQKLGTDYNGAFPLRGKLLNARDATVAQITKNQEIQNIIRILGLTYGRTYTAENLCDARTGLRYGCVCIVTDQDLDGAHIKGLILNLFDKLWPSLLTVPGFLCEFRTPLLKATVGNGKRLSFFDQRAFDAWLAALSASERARVRNVKYYKGLGTSTPDEAREYFRHLSLHTVRFLAVTGEEPARARAKAKAITTASPRMAVEGEDEDQEEEEDEDEKTTTAPTPKGDEEELAARDALDLAFRKTRAEHRKQWLLAGNAAPSDALEPLVQGPLAGAGGLGTATPLAKPIAQFVDRELIEYCWADNVRSIPNVLDGFKPSMRKVLFGCLKSPSQTSVKVAQLAARVAEASRYHHGEVSLQGTIVKMAQDFVGANNLPLLVPDGQFGSRNMGGADAASARYIFTCLDPVTRLVFPEIDDSLLPEQRDEGYVIEPAYYVPIIPMLLVNGSEGIGTGWSTSVPMYNPRDVIAAVRAWIAGPTTPPLPALVPWYNGFRGRVLRAADNTSTTTFLTTGILEQDTGPNSDQFRVTELPVGLWFAKYKTILETQLLRGADRSGGGGGGGGADAASVGSGAAGGTGAGAGAPFVLALKCDDGDVRATYHMQVDLAALHGSMNNAGLESLDMLRRFKLVTSVSTTNMHAFDADGRMRRFDSAEDILHYFCTHRAPLYARRKEKQLRQMRLRAAELRVRARFIECVLSQQLVVSRRAEAAVLADFARLEPPDETELPVAVFDRHDLLAMPMRSLTAERIADMTAKVERLRADITQLDALSPTQLWLADLDALEKHLDERDAARAAKEQRIAEEEAAEEARLAAGSAADAAGGGGGRGRSASKKKAIKATKVTKAAKKK